LFTEALPESSVTLPRWGMMRDGVCWERLTPGHHTSATEYGSLLPTPTTTAVSTTKTEQTYARNMSRTGHPTWQAVLAVAARKWPTPTDHSWKEKGYPAEYNRATSGLGSVVLKPHLWPTPQASDCRNRGNADTPAVARRIEAGKQITLTMTVTGGQLSPTWVEWLMGWPLGWTDCAVSATDRFQKWCASHGAR
jgi:hypothetical protein